jgi:hypothetical protein
MKRIQKIAQGLALGVLCWAVVLRQQQQLPSGVRDVLLLVRACLTGMRSVISAVPLQLDARNHLCSRLLAV